MFILLDFAAYKVFSLEIFRSVNKSSVWIFFELCFVYAAMTIEDMEHLQLRYVTHLISFFFLCFFVS